MIQERSIDSVFGRNKDHPSGKEGIGDHCDDTRIAEEIEAVDEAIRSKYIRAVRDEQKMNM